MKTSVMAILIVRACGTVIALQALAGVISYAAMDLAYLFRTPPKNPIGEIHWSPTIADWQNLLPCILVFAFGALIFALSRPLSRFFRIGIVEE